MRDWLRFRNENLTYNYLLSYVWDELVLTRWQYFGGIFCINSLFSSLIDKVENAAAVFVLTSIQSLILLALVRGRVRNIGWNVNKWTAIFFALYLYIIVLVLFSASLGEDKIKKFIDKIGALGDLIMLIPIAVSLILTVVLLFKKGAAVQEKFNEHSPPSPP